MPTHHRGIKAKDWIEGENVEDCIEDIIDIEKPKERFVIGPNGEKRPMSSISSVVRAFEVATGQREEEYVDGMRRPPKKKVQIL